MPKQIQRKRTKGWRMPSSTVYVGRPSALGNPFTLGSCLGDYITDGTIPYEIIEMAEADGLIIDVSIDEYIISAKDCVKLYKSYVLYNKFDLSHLFGKNLACWCSLDKPCHAGILLKLANTIRWGGLYREQWGSKIVPEAFSHPAKFAPGLIDKIYEFLIERGDLQIGDTAVDPFGGVALGARSAMANGVNWCGVELEQRFVDIGGGTTCDGYSKGDWRRMNGRADAVRANGRDEHKLCPACVVELDNVTEPARSLNLLSQPVAVRRNRMREIVNKKNKGRGGAKKIKLVFREKLPLPSSKASIVANRKFIKVGLFSNDFNNTKITPSRAPHEYRGNIGKWEDEGVSKHGATAVLAQGDSRDFFNILTSIANGGRVKATVASPPFGQGETRNRTKFSGGEIASMMGRAYTIDRQGADSGNLAALGDGGFAAAVSSSPYADVVKNGDGTGVRFDTTHHSEENGRKHSSRSDYGSDAGNIGNMAGDGFQAAVSSPPFEDSLARDGLVQSSRRAVADAGGIANTDKVSPIDMERIGGRTQTYGRLSSNIGNDGGETFWSAARMIVEQTYAVLQPGGVAAWVCKDFVRNKQIVHFSDQWEELCLAVGFEFDVRIHAMLIDERGYQLNVFGGEKDLSVKRMSFFRRLHETKYPHLAIDWEDVVIVRKPMGKI